MVIWMRLDLDLVGEKVIVVEMVVENLQGELSGIRMR